ncbi:hypothetical protein Tco_1148995 [Tanacetum coccineum]
MGGVVWRYPVVLSSTHSISADYVPVGCRVCHSHSYTNVRILHSAARLREGCKKLRATSKDVRKHLKTQILEAVNSGQLWHLVKGIKKERTKSSNTPRGESKKDKGTAPAKAPILMVNNAPVIIEAKIFGRKVGRVYMDSGSSCEIIYEHCFKKLKPTIKATKVDLETPLVGFSGECSWSIGEVPLEITIGDAPLSRT